MVLNLVLPEIGTNPSTKDCIIGILTNEWPLSLREIFFRAKKKYKISCSYQAIFKSVKELVEKKVLIDSEKGFEINIDWIKNVQSFTDIVETNYYAKAKVQSPSGLKGSSHGGDMIILDFESIFDAEKYLYYFIKSELLKTKNDKIFWQLTSEWRPIFYLRSEYNFYRRLSSHGHKFYFLCSGNSEIEFLCGDFYKKLNLKFKFVKDNFPNDSIIFSDYLISIFVPNNLKIKLKNFLKEKKIFQILQEILEAKSSIKVIINKDAELVKDLKKQLSLRFKRSLQK